MVCTIKRIVRFGKWYRTIITWDTKNINIKIYYWCHGKSGHTSTPSHSSGHFSRAIEVATT